MFLPHAMVTPPTLSSRLAGPMRRQHALLINPFYAKDPHASFGKHVLTPTLALTTVASATPEHWTVDIWDENLLQGPPPTDPLPQVVGITVHLTFAKRAYELAAYYRARGATIVLGGLHVLSCPEEVRMHADIIATGDGVQTWHEILHDIDRGRVRSHYHADFTRHYRLDPPPRRDLLPRDSFLTTSSVIATRGCHNRCGFCYLATDGLTMPYQVRDPQQVVNELLADGQPYAVFTDNNLGSKREYLRSLCQALAPLKKIWSAAVTIDVTDDPSLVRAMALAGCTGVFIGFESMTDENLTDARKKTPRVNDYLRRVKILHDNGIQVNGSFVLGFDHDKPDCFARTVQWIEDAKLECATFHILTPYPATPLFRQMEAENRLLHRDWSKYDTANVVFQPKHMTVDQLADGYAWCYRRLFSHRSIWARRPEDWRAIAPYMAMSYLYKKSNRVWPFLIKHRLVHRAWYPLIELSRRRHQKFRARLAKRPITGTHNETPPLRAETLVSAGV